MFPRIPTGQALEPEQPTREETVARLRCWSSLALAIVVLGGMGCTKSETTLTAQDPLMMDAAGETLRLDEAKVPVVASCSSGQVVQKTGSGWTCSTPGPGGVP